jgi:biotin synthase
MALEKNSNKFKRVCIQAINYSNVVEDLCELVARVKNVCNLPISVSCQPLKKKDIERLSAVGAERICVALDAATPELFERIKGGGYTWEGHLQALEHARATFDNRVSTHLIVGLGESEEEMVRAIQLLHDQDITIGLFAFTPIAGTSLSGCPRPNVASYRRIQLARFLIVNNLSRTERMRFENERVVDFGVLQDVLNKAIESGEPFRTSGCPGCNRPFYNESPRGPIYNYPASPAANRIADIKKLL